MLDLNAYLGKKVSELPIELKNEILKSFVRFDQDDIEDSELQTWDDFIYSCVISDGTEDPSYWWNTFESSKSKYWLNNKVVVCKLNILDFVDVRYETSREHWNLAIVDWGEPALIINADDFEFGSGYIILKVEPPSDDITDYGKGYLLTNKLMNFDDALKEAKDLMEELSILE